MLPCNLQVLTLGVGHSLRLGGVVLPNSLKTFPVAKLVRSNAAERPAADIVLLVEGSDAT